MPQLDHPPSIPVRRFGSPNWIARLIATALLVAFAIGVVEWFIIRVEVNAGEIMALVNKTGRRLPDDLASEFDDQVVLYPELVQALVSKSGDSEDDVRREYKGIRCEVFSEGRYFPNPYSFKALKFNATAIGQNEVGILVRKFGRPHRSRGRSQSQV